MIEIQTHVAENALFTISDLKPDGDPRWCPGCGNYSVLAQMKKVLPGLGIPQENFVFVSGIGCSSRFPYYINTYGFHTIHGRAPAIATGLKLSRPELQVWVITGDGDAMSIGGNHLIHLFRRNIDLKVLLFNNQIYGLTKGQASPTSPSGTKSKSSPYGTIDSPFNPPELALGSGASFIARTMDRDLQHLYRTLEQAAKFSGTTFVEVYQNCVVFNDGAFEDYTDKQVKFDNAIFVEHGSPMVFGASKNLGIRLDGLHPHVVQIGDGQWSVDDVVVYDQTDKTLAGIVARMSDTEGFPKPFGVLYASARPTFDSLLHARSEQHGRLDATTLERLLRGKQAWEVSPTDRHSAIEQ